MQENRFNADREDLRKDKQALADQIFGRFPAHLIVYEAQKRFSQATSRSLSFDIVRYRSTDERRVHEKRADLPIWGIGGC